MPFAVELLSRVGPVLSQRGILFKAPQHLDYVSYLNCGLFYGFSQIGKIITVYPGKSLDVVELGHLLVQTCRGLRGPDVSTDFRLSTAAPVFVRYGAYAREADGRSSSLVNPTGQEEPDLRAIGQPFPSWIKNPFPECSTSQQPSPLTTRFLTYNAISQRGKGGVYQALDVGARPARLCVLKEARTEGEFELDNRPAFVRLRHEAHVMRALRRAGVRVPTVYRTFRAGDCTYIAIQYIEGRTLQSLLGSRRFTRSKRIDLAKLLCRELRKVHKRGWAWRDLKPANILVTSNGSLYLIDFEGACRLRSTHAQRWGSISYTPPFEPNRRCLHEAHDVFALAVTIEQILTNCAAPSISSPAISRAIPRRIHELISAAHDRVRLEQIAIGAFLKALEQPDEVRAA